MPIWVSRSTGSSIEGCRLLTSSACAGSQGWDGAEMVGEGSKGTTHVGRELGVAHVSRVAHHAVMTFAGGWSWRMVELNCTQSIVIRDLLDRQSSRCVRGTAAEDFRGRMAVMDLGILGH